MPSATPSGVVPSANDERVERHLAEPERAVGLAEVVERERAVDDEGLPEEEAERDGREVGEDERRRRRRARARTDPDVRRPRSPDARHWPGVGCPISRQATSILLALATVVGAALLAAPAAARAARRGAPQSLDDVLAAVQGLSGKARTDKLVELADEPRAGS